MRKLRWGWQQRSALCMLKQERRQRPQLQGQLIRMGNTYRISDAFNMPGRMEDPTEADWFWRITCRLRWKWRQRGGRQRHRQERRRSVLLHSLLIRTERRRLCASELGTTGRTSTLAVLETPSCARLPERISVCSPLEGRPGVRCAL